MKELAENNEEMKNLLQASKTSPKGTHDNSINIEQDYNELCKSVSSSSIAKDKQKF